MKKSVQQKDSKSFSIAGKEIDVLKTSVDINDIDFDPENPRIGYWTDNQAKQLFTQEEISFVLGEKDDQVDRLKYSIETNEGILNPIWVYPTSKNKYLVIDGNTRLQIYRDLNQKYPQKNCYKKIPCNVLPKDIDNKVKNYVRLIGHLRGENEWEVYERARMLYILWEKEGYTEEELKAQTKLSIGEIRKWIEAYKNMTQQFLPNYKDLPGALNKFSYFIEYENPKIKQGMAEIGLTVEDFSDWVGKEEISKAQDVRNLRKIFESKNEKIKKTLAKKGYSQAIYELNIEKPSLKSKLFEEIEDVIYRLKSMKREEEEEIIEGDSIKKIKLLKELSDELNKIIKKAK